jgi:hypothetical protein
MKYMLSLISVCPQSRLLCGQTLHFLAQRLRKCVFQSSLSIMCPHYRQTLIKFSPMEISRLRQRGITPALTSRSFPIHIVLKN